MSSTVTTTRIHVPDADLADLRDRLARTRWPDEQPGVGDTQGVPLAVARELADAWAAFDWRAREDALNAFHQVRVEDAAGTPVHAIHERSADPDAPALVLLHGWPNTLADLAGLVPALREHAHVVVPALPGFPLSGPTPGPGWGTPRLADAVAALMSALGYERFAVHGADTGAIVGRHLAVEHAERVTLLHSVGIDAPPPAPDDELDDEDRARLAEGDEYLYQHSGYAMEQSQRPQTLGYGLTDSPVGQLTWIAEKLRDWADPATPVPREAILTGASLYWFTASAPSAARLYWEGGQDGSWFAPPAPNPTPTAVAVFPNGLAGGRPVRRLAERANNIVRWTEFDRGGHFPALEVPDLLVEDVLAALAQVR